MDKMKQQIAEQLMAEELSRSIAYDFMWEQKRARIEKMPISRYKYILAEVITFLEKTVNVNFPSLTDRIDDKQYEALAKEIIYKLSQNKEPSYSTNYYLLLEETMKLLKKIKEKINAK